MGPVAERFLGRCSATAKRHPFFDREFIPIAVHQFYLTLHDVRAILDCLDCDHVDTVAYVERAENVVQAAVSAACTFNQVLGTSTSTTSCDLK
jgi:hypothetical protein